MWAYYIGPLTKQRESFMDIRKHIRKSQTILFTDDEFFNREVTGVKNLSDIKDIIGIKGTLKKVGEYSNKLVYQLSSDYNFTLTFIYK